MIRELKVLLKSNRLSIILSHESTKLISLTFVKFSYYTFFVRDNNIA